jgi:hypothetical protein
MIGTEYILIVILGLLVIISLILVIRMEYRLKRLFRGKNGSDVEDSLKIINMAIDRLRIAQKSSTDQIELHEKKLSETLRGIHTVRFNPFPELGSNQSFAIALLNENGDGVVISSLYTRERVSVFAKPVKNMHSEYELTDEEKEALLKAKI